MTTTTKLILATSLSAFAVGTSGFFWGIGFPVGAILLGFFLIRRTLEKEAASFDQEATLRFSEAQVQGGNRNRSFPTASGADSALQSVPRRVHQA